MNEKRRGLLGQIWEISTSPRAGYQSVTDGDFYRGLIIVIFTAVVSVSAASIYMSKIPMNLLLASLASYNIDPVTILQAMGTFAAVGGFIRVLIDWILLTLMIHALGSIFSGKGSLKRFFAMTGFAYLPFTVQQILRLIDAVTVQPATLVGVYVSNASATGLMKIFVSMNVFTLFGIVALILKGYAISSNYNSTTRKGVLIATIPYIIFVIIDVIL